MPDFFAAKNENPALVTFIVLRQLFSVSNNSSSKELRRRSRDEEIGADSGRHEEIDFYSLEWQGQESFDGGCTCVLIYCLVFTAHYTAC